MKIMNEIISIKLNKADKEFLKNESIKARLTLSSYIRYKILSNCNKE
jgi:hypothetical protein